MSSLSFENIDRWLFEYAEGNLSPEQVGQLEHFISMHPELQLDLDAWKSAKITPEAETTLNIAAFQKSYNVWPLITTVFLAFLGVGAFLYLYDFTTDTKYAQKSIDAELIFDEDDFVFAGKTSSSMVESSQESFQVSTELAVSNNEATLTKINLTTASFNAPVQSVQFSVSSVKKAQPLSFANSTNPSSAFMGSDWKIDFQSDLAAWLFEAPELDRVKSALANRSDESNDFALQLNSSASTASKMKSSLSKKAKSMFRKVQRMMDQPVALRNFKDPHYAIPNLSSYQANFGMAGTMIQHRFQATSRNQWVGRDNQQLMNRIAWDGYIRPLRGGVGIDLNYNDYQNGSVRDMSFGVTYSPKFSISRNVSFEPAVRFKMGMTDVNLSSGIIGSTIEMNRRNSIAMFENGQTPLGSQLWYRDMGVGALVNTKWFYAGLNLDNVGRHYNNFYSSDLTQNHTADLDFSAVFGTEYKSLNKDITLSTYAYYQKFGEVNEVWGGANFRWRNIQVGGAASNKLDLGATAGIVFDRFTVHYILDYLTSVVLDQRMLSHQVTMRMLLKPSRLTMKFLNM